MKLLCRLFGHRRSAPDAWLSEQGWRSRCKYCGKPMIRRGPEEWLLEEIEATDIR